MQMTEGQYIMHTNEYDGYCTQCKKVTNIGGVEPDAENYDCEVCYKPSVIGVEQAMLIGLLNIVGNE